MEIKKDILWRVYLCFLCMIILGMVVIGRAFFIQTAEGKFWRSMGDSLHLRYMPIEAQRGSIFSEDGNMLSTSVPIFDVYIDFEADGLREKDGARFKKNIDSLSYCLAELFKDKSKDDYQHELQLGFTTPNLRHYLLKRKISFVEYKSMRDFPLIRDGKNKSGFIFDQRDKRINPYGLMANRTIGLSRDIASKNVGLEQSYDSFLRGTTGQRLMRYIAGAYMPVEGAELEPENGKDVVTTLDTYIQDVTERALYNMVSNNNSIHGTAIVMEVATGKIKAIANLGRQPDSISYKEDLNYGVAKATEPGSVFKLATLLSLLEDKYVTKNTVVDCEGGKKRFANLTIKDSHLGARELKVIDAFLRSSNVAFAKLADQYYGNQPQKFIDHLHRLRLDQMTGIDITATSGKPTIKTPKNRSWSGTTIPYMAHGYEELVTPLHLLMVYNAVANNGKMMKPYLVNSVLDYGVEMVKYNPIVLEEKICSDETLAQLKECLGAVVDSAHGTAHNVLFDSAYSIAGKTGTAVSALNNGGYNKGNKIYQSSFIGYFPANAPKYSIAVVIQNSRESKYIYGADVSGRVFKEISDKVYNKYVFDHKNKNLNVVDTNAHVCFGMKQEMMTISGFLNLKMTDSSDGNIWRTANIRNGAVALESSPITVANNISIVPNIIGMGLKDAVYVAENNGLKVAVSGKGRVVSQSPKSGEALVKGKTITLFLN